MKIQLPQLVDNIRNYMGLLRKRPIEEIFTKLLLHGQPGPHLPNFGDDAAVIPWKEGFLLLAADGMMTRLLINEPYAAGKSSVMVTVNDIYSMGGNISYKQLANDTIEATVYLNLSDSKKTMSGY